MFILQLNFTKSYVNGFVFQSLQYLLFKIDFY